MPLGYDPTVDASLTLIEGSIPKGDEGSVLDPYQGDKNDQEKRKLFTQDENEFDPADTSGADVSAMMIPASLRSEGPADEWVPVDKAPTPATPAASTSPRDEWVPVEQAAMPSPPIVSEPGTISLMAHAFGEAFHEDWKEPLGFSKETTDALSESGIFAPSDQDRYTNPFKAFNELLFVGLGAGVPRVMGSVIHGAQAALRAVPQSQVQKLLGERTLSSEAAGFLDYFTTGQAELGFPKPPGVERPQGFLEKPVDLGEAKGLGVIGPEPLPRDAVPPEEAAKRAIPAEQQVPTISGQPPEETPWMQRWKETGRKLTTDTDMQELWVNVARENNEFPEIRQGSIPPQHIQAVAEASGIPSASIDVEKLSAKYKSNAEIQAIIQSMMDATEHVREASRALTVDPNPENMIAMREASLRHEMVVGAALRDSVENVVGLRAEFGRTGNVLQEFMRTVKDAESLKDHLRDIGQKPEDLIQAAKGINALPRSGAAGMLNDLRKPGAFDKFMWYWTNNLISGYVTHTKYVLANSLFLAHEAALVTPVAGAYGALRRAATGSTEGVRPSESLGAIWGMIAGVPDALKAATTAFKSGLQTPLPGELALEITPKKNIFFQQRGSPTTAAGQIFGIPSKGAAGIHSFFNFLGYRYSLEKQAFRQAAQEGLNINDQAFWDRRQTLANQPTEEMMKEAIGEGYRLTYIKELGPWGKAVNTAVNKVPPLRLVMPFTHIPFNVFGEGVEAAGLGLLKQDSRDALLSKSGAVKHDMAVARMTVGAAIGVGVANLIGNDRMTGGGPTDPKERAAWFASGHQPYSIRVGDEWISYNRFGSIGVALGLQADIAEVIPHLTKKAAEGGDVKFSEAINFAVHNTGHLVMDEVGMTGIQNLFDAAGGGHEGERKITSFAANTAGSLLPWSSALRQTASAMDPEMRQAKTIIDGLKYYLPGARETLLPNRDALGSPIPNPGYGGDLPVPGVSSVIRHGSAIPDPMLFEMQRVGLNMAKPKNLVGGVQLPPELYDKYQDLAGAWSRTALEAIIHEPRYGGLQEGAKADLLKSAVTRAREAAGKILQVQRPDVIQQGIQQNKDRIFGIKTPKMAGEPSQLGEFFKGIAKGVSGMLPAEPPPEPIQQGVHLGTRG